MVNVIRGFVVRKCRKKGLDVWPTFIRYAVARGTFFHLIRNRFFVRCLIRTALTRAPARVGGACPVPGGVTGEAGIANTHGDFV